MTRPLWPLTPDPWNVHLFNGAASASGAESRSRGARTRRRRRTRPVAPRPRHAAAARTLRYGPGPRAVARAGREGARGALRGAAPPGRAPEKRRVDSILGLRARPF